MADLFLKYRCGYCQDEILGIRIRCNVCADYELCLQCFSLGCEMGPHKASHGYRIMDPGTFSIFPEKTSNQTRDDESKNWSAREEYQLLDAIEQFGYGNFEDVAKHVETRDSEEAKDHYCQRYVNGAIGRATWPLPNGLLSNGEARLDAIDHTCPVNGTLSPSITSRLPPLVIQAGEALELGYMPQRDDFEREYDNEAESVVSHLSMNHDDEDIDLALKLAQVDIFTRRLRERARRKRVARDFQLISQFFNSMKKEKEKPAPAAKKREAQKEKEMQEKFRVFSQFHTATEHDQFLRNLAKERSLRMRIRELTKYRRNGLTRQEECTEFERARYFRERRKEARQERLRRKSGSSGPGPGQNPGTLPKSADNDKGEVQLSSYREGKLGIISSASVLSVSNSNNNIVGSGNPSRTRGLPSASLYNISMAATGTDSEWQDAVAAHISRNDDLMLCPGSELLSSIERQICQSLRLRPLYYLSIKTNLVLSGTDKTPLLPGLAAEEQKIIVNYFTKAGFLSSGD